MVILQCGIEIIDFIHIMIRTFVIYGFFLKLVESKKDENLVVVLNSFVARLRIRERRFNVAAIVISFFECE